MESNEAREALREADRAAAAPWIDYPPTPWWYAPAVAAYAAAMTLAFGLLDGVVRALAQLALVALIGLFVGWYRRYRGTMPAGRAPREMRVPLLVFVGCATALVASVWLVASAWLDGNVVSVVAAAALAAVGAGVLVWWYERVYAAAARRARERLG